MWQRQLVQLQRDFPQIITLYEPCTDNQIQRSAQLLDLELPGMDPDWLAFLRLTNGASILAYSFVGAMASRTMDITKANSAIWHVDDYYWIREHFVRFLVDCSPMSIGFVREGQQLRCIAFLSELTDTSVLPIASSFEAFMTSFLQDVDAVLRSWEPIPGEEWPYGISDVWPLDLQSWCDRDPRLKSMLQQGALDDLFRHSDEYTAIVDSCRLD